MSGTVVISKDQQDTEPDVAPDALPPSEAPVVDSRPNYSVFTTWEKRLIVLGSAAGAFLSPLTAQIYLPALNQLSDDFKISSSQINLTVTTYMIFQGITPMFIGSLADSAGRRPAYLICFVVYIAADIGCALAPNYAALLVLRMLQSAGSSTTVALCQAVVSDVVTSAERGQYVSFTSVPIILAPSLGPVAGGLISQYIGWRWIFWILAILAGVICIGFALFMPETCRSIVDDGSVRPHRFYRTFWQLGKEALAQRKGKRDGNDLSLQQSHVSTSRSLKFKGFDAFRSLIILFELEMFLLLMYSSIVFAGFYAVATSLPSQFEDIYGFNNIQIGLMYLPLAGGSVVVAFGIGRAANWNYRRYCRELGVPYEKSKQQDLAAFPIEKARLEVGIPLMVVGALVLIGWGWALQYRAHLAVPCVLLFLMGVTMVGFSNTVNILIVDLNPGNAGAATASNNVTRCLIGAAASAVIDPMIVGIGSGWSFFIIGGLYIAGAPAIYFVMKNGVKWRKANIEKKRLRQEKADANNDTAGADGGEKNTQGPS